MQSERNHASILVLVVRVVGRCKGWVWWVGEVGLCQGAYCLWYGPFFVRCGVVVGCLDGEPGGGVRWPGSEVHKGEPVGRGLVAPGLPAQTLVPTILACLPAKLGDGGVSLPDDCGVPETAMTLRRWLAVWQIFVGEGGGSFGLVWPGWPVVLL
jgi:hypothetical protein